jgi:pre-mRNA-splicing factor 38A
LVANSLDVWKYLEPLYNDYRKLRYMDRMGTFSVLHMDEFIDLLLREDRVFDIILPRISKRQVHEEAGELELRVSALDEDFNDADDSDE